MTPHRPARYRLISHPDVLTDLRSLAAYGADVVDAVRVALDDLAHGRITGKALGQRQVSGDHNVYQTDHGRPLAIRKRR